METLRAVVRFGLPRMALVLALGGLPAQTARANPHLGDESPPDVPIRRLTFTGEPAWLVIGEALRSERLAAVRCGERVAAGVPATPLRTDLFANLRPRLVVLIYGAFPTRALAETFAVGLRGKGVATTIKHSGAVKPSRAGTASRLVRLWGKLYDDIAPTARIDITGDDIDAVAYSTKDGWWQAWVRVDAGKRVELQLLSDPEMTRAARASCDRGDPGGWFDRAETVTLEPPTRDLFVGWSPSPDCHGE